MLRSILKNFKLVLFVILVSTLASCKKDPGILFCEGLTTDGKETNCGTVFTIGDLTAVIKRARGFGSNSLTVDIYERRNSVNQKIESINIDVKNTDTQANTNLSFYNTGVFQVEVKANDTVIAQHSIAIQDE